MSETPIILYRCPGSCKESVKILEEFADKTIETKPVPEKAVGVREFEEVRHD